MSTSMKTTTYLGTRTVRILLLGLILILSLPVVFANTVERSFSTQTVQPKTEISVTLTIDVTEAQFYSWQETVPAGWTIVRTSRGQIAGRTIADVVFGGVQDTTAEYVVRLPDALGPHAFRGTYMFSGMEQETPITGPDTVTVQTRLGGAGAPCGVDADCGADNLFCVDFVCDSSLCTDTDGENSPIVAGVATLDNEVAVDVVKKDECFNPSQTNEWYCLSPEGGLANLHVPCPEGTTCQPNAEGIGVCRAAPPPPPPPPGGGLGTLDQACRRAEHKCDVNLVCNLDNICEEAPPPVHFENEGCGPDVNAVCAENLICRKKDMSKLILQCLPPAPQGGFCEETDDCTAGFTCQTNHCLPPPPGPGAGNLGAPCGVDADCGADNLFCVDFVCDSSICTDTDEGNSPIVAGVATLDNAVAVDVVKKDECDTPSQTTEWFCLTPEGDLSRRFAPCPQGAKRL